MTAQKSNASYSYIIDTLDRKRKIFGKFAMKRNICKKRVRFGTSKKSKKVFVNKWNVESVEEAITFVADWRVEPNENCNG